MPEPEATVAEMARVARRHLLVSVPREPLWRGLNMARGRLPARPRQHAGPREPLVKRAFVSLLSRYGTVEEARSPFPWTMLLVRVSPAAPGPVPTAAYGRGAAVLSVGIGVTGLVTFAYFALASHSLPEDEYGRITLLWSAIFITVSVLYRPVEQLLSRTIADHDARGIEGTHHLRVAATIQLALAVAFAVAALALRGPIQDDLLGGSAALYWCSSSPCSPTPRATSRAASWPGTTTSASTAGSC